MNKRKKMRYIVNLLYPVKHLWNIISFQKNKVKNQTNRFYESSLFYFLHYLCSLCQYHRTRLN